MMIDQSSGIQTEDYGVAALLLLLEDAMQACRSAANDFESCQQAELLSVPVMSDSSNKPEYCMVVITKPRAALHPSK
jgi:hypothetical protein